VHAQGGKLPLATHAAAEADFMGLWIADRILLAGSRLAHTYVVVKLNGWAFRKNRGSSMKPSC
jgi:hypothetical protein